MKLLKQTDINIYKHNFTSILRMFPSDPTGSLDDFIFKSPVWLLCNTGFPNFLLGLNGEKIWKKR